MTLSQFPQYQKILVELTGEHEQEYALEQALLLLAAFPEAELLLLRSPRVTELIVGLPHHNAYELLEEQALAQAQEYCRGWQSRLISEGFRVTIIVERGVTAAEIYRVAEREGADIIVVGSEGVKGPFTRWVQGDRSFGLIRHGDLPVLVAPTRHPKELTFSGVAPNGEGALQESDRSPQRLARLFPSYRSREEEVTFFLERVQEQGTLVAVLGPMGKRLKKALDDRSLDVCLFRPEEHPEIEPRDAILLPFLGLSRLEDLEAQMKVLSLCHQLLKPGGVLIADLFNPWLHLPVDIVVPSRDSDGVSKVRLGDGVEVRRHVRVVARDFLRQTQCIEEVFWITEGDGSLESQSRQFVSRFFSRFEFQHLLARCGFDIEAVFGSRYPGDLVIVARRST